MRLPEKHSIQMEIINLLITDQIQTADQPQSQVQRLRKYTSIGVRKTMHKMLDAGYIDRVGDSFCLTQAAYDLFTGGKYKGSVAAPRSSNVFAETNGAIDALCAGMRRNLLGRLA